MKHCNTTLPTFKKGFSLIESSIVILIIGLLITGIMEGRDLSRSFKLDATRKLTHNSPAATIEDLVAWYDSTAQESFDSSIDEDNPNKNTISDWYDINPHTTLKRHGFQATTANQPTFAYNQASQLPMVLFDGENDCIQLPNHTVPFEDNSYTIFIVAQVVSNTTGNRSFLSAEGEEDTNLNILRYDDNNLKTISGQWDITYAANNVDIDKNMLITHAYSNGYAGTKLARNMTSYKNGEQLTYYKHDVQLDSLTPSSALETAVINNGLGCRINNTSTQGVDFFSGFIGEVIIFNRHLDRDEREAIDDYLGQKWGIRIAH